ncbi:MAG: 4Fe-4S dicluster domain-containing protein, partial [Spongiibacteraceae bacterium]
RFQSVMFDRDTLIVSYDAKRGDPRGSRKKDIDPRTVDLGDCIDCKICVQVCPTGIDIRNGLQYECINCALCVDGCDSVMDKMGYPRGLIRYTTENVLAGKPYRWLRPRLIGYAIALLTMVSIFVYVLLNRVPLHADVIREREHLFRLTSDGLVENTYLLKIINMDQRGHTFRVGTSGLNNARIVGNNVVAIDGGDLLELPLRLTIDPGLLRDTGTKIEFHIEATDDPDLHTTVESRFLGPRTH